MSRRTPPNHPSLHQQLRHSSNSDSMTQGHPNQPGYPTYASFNMNLNFPMSSPSTYPSSHPPFGARPAAHQLQHPDHAGARVSPYALPQMNKSFANRTISQTSSPDASSNLNFVHHLSLPAIISAPTLDTPLARPGDLSDASSVKPAKRGRPATKKRKADDHDSKSREPSVEPSAAAAASSSDQKDSKTAGRVAKACQPCSTKKRRCDGRQPECSVCQVLGTPCTYNHTGLKRGPPKGFRSGPKESARAKLIRSLETTVRDLINHLGKDEAGSEILRVTADRELGLGKPGDFQGGARSAIKKEPHDVRFAQSTSKGKQRHNQDDSASGNSDQDVIGETRMGELVYRGSSSGIGILQRQHQGESPAPQQLVGNAGLTGSGSLERSKLDPSAIPRLGARMPSHNPQQGPVFLPIASPRTSHQSGGGDTPSSSNQSPQQPKASPIRIDGKSPYESTNRDKTSQAQVETAAASSDPVVSKEENERLFSYYWQGFHPFWPMLYKPWMTSIPVEELRYQLEPCLLFSIYAIAACIVPGDRARQDAEERELHDRERASLFCEAAERHIFARRLRPDTALIQSCWLLGLFSHGIGDLSRAWNFQNLAYSMAVDLGLHRWPIYRSEIMDDAVRRETRIRLIWHCYIMDKLLCAEMGRPVGLKFKDCDVPLLSETEDDEFDLWSEQTEMHPGGQGTSEGERSGTARRLHAPSCLNWGIHLFRIVERILDEVHSMRRKALLRRQGKAKILVELDCELTNWKETLPKHLHLEQETQDGPLPSFFALNMWYFTSRLLLHRPFIPQEEGLSLSEVLSNDSHKKSTEAANTICDLLEKSSTDFVDRLSTDLGYCLFTAAVMFVFNARLPDPEISSDARRRYDLCKQWLKKLADTWPAASTHKLLLDGFALVGEDASKSIDAQGRRPSAVALSMLQQQQQQNAGAFGVTAWITKTDAATKATGGASTGQSTVQGQSSGLGVPFSGVQNQPGLLVGQQLAFPSSNNLDGSGFDFAPGIFDVESFFWNENVAANAPFMQAPYGFPGYLAQSYPSSSNGAEGLAMFAQVTNDRQQQPYGNLAGMRSQQGVGQVQQQSLTGAARPQQAQGTMSPLGAFDANSTSMGEFWNMLELPPTFL